MILRLIIVGALILALLLGIVVTLILLPFGSFGDRAFVYFPSGTSSREMGRRLAEAGVIRDERQFYLVRAMRPRARLQAGEYEFKKSASTWEVFDRIVRGDVFHYVLIVPEGSNLFDIAAALDRTGVISGKEFMQAARDPSLIRDIAPKAETLEGYLFPDTYRYLRGNTGGQLARRMTNRFRQVWGEVGYEGADVHHYVTLASLVEKETGVPEERGLVASVFANRLKRNMLLQCDPTTIYAALLEGRYRGTIYMSDLRSRHPYNTYIHPGLPPGPIANPGRASLRAAMRPDPSDYLFFVAKPGSKSHRFSSGIGDHNRAVQEYRRGLREQAKQANSTGTAP